MKKALIITGCIVGILILVIVALPFLVDVNHFRPMIEAQAQQALGRPVQIGNMSLSLLAGGVTAENISIGEDPKFGQQPFLRAKSLDVGVEMMPLLLSRTLHVTGLTLREPEVRLVKSAGGRWNFSSLGSSSAPAAALSRSRGRTQPPAAPATAAATPDISIDSLKIADGRLIVANAANPARATTYDNLQLKASDITFHTAIPFDLEMGTPGGGSVKASGKAGPVNRENAAETPVNANITVRKLDLAATGVVDPSSGLAGLLDYDGALHSNGKTAQTQGKVTADRLKLVRGGAPARTPLVFDYATETDVQREAGSLTKGNIVTGHTAAHLAGTYATQGAATVVHMRLTGQNMPVSDLEGLLPAMGVVLPPGASLQGGVANANLAIDGPLDHLVITGPLGVSNTRLAGFNLASKMSAIAALAGVHGGNETDIQTLASNLRVAPEGIHADNLQLILPALGQISGSGNIGANNALDFHMLAKLAHGGGALGALSAFSTLGQSKGAIPFTIKGTTSNPIFIPDVGKAIGSSVTAPAQGVGGLFNGLFGHKQQTQQQPH
jgi:AsmA protein